MKGRISTAAPRVLAYALHSLRPILHITCPSPMLSYSKGSRGLFVPSRGIGIFTDTTISLSSRLRQCPDHYTIRAGRNLPDKEFRYLRTVIVTAAVHCASSCNEDPFSRSYRDNLPSSLTVIHSSALVYSTRPRVSVYGTGATSFLFSGFSWEYALLACPEGRAILSGSTPAVDLPAAVGIYTLQPSFPSDGGTFTAPSPRHGMRQ